MEAQGQARKYYHFKKGGVRVNAASEIHGGATGIRGIRAIPLAREEDVYDLEKNARAGLYYSRALRRKEGDDILGVAMYNMGPGNFEKHNKAWWTVDETRNYVHGVMAGVNKQVPVPYDADAANDSMKPLPEEHNKRLKEQQRYEAKITLDGTFNLNSPDGKLAALPVNAQKIVSLPIPFGAR